MISVRLSSCGRNCYEHLIWVGLPLHMRLPSHIHRFQQSRTYAYIRSDRTFHASDSSTLPRSIIAPLDRSLDRSIDIHTCSD